jgi:UDP-glucuronate decarboxylase
VGGKSTTADRGALNAISPGSAAAESARLYDEGLQRTARLPVIDRFRNRDVAILGCTGLIGGALTRVLMAANSLDSQNPIRIHGVARRPLNGSFGAPADGFTFVRSSVADDAAHDVVAAADFTVYIAGTTRDFASRPRETLETQMVALERCLSAARPNAGFVYISSVRVFGRESRDEPFAEDSKALIPVMHIDNLYDSAKRWGESLCLLHATRGGARAVVVRLTAIYGPVGVEPPQTVLTEFVRQAVTTRRIAVENPGALRNQCSVLDAVQGILLALVHGKPGRPYHIGSREHLTSRDLADSVRRHLSFAVEVVEPHEPPPASVQRISIERAAAELAFEPEYEFEQLAPFVVEQTARAFAPGAADANA